MSLAIVTTGIDPDASFPTWLAHHAARAELLVLFADAPAQVEQFRALCAGRRAIVLPGFQADPGGDGASALSRRQEHNAAAAVPVVMAAGIDWLLHIDLDELYDGPRDAPWEHDPEAGQVTFVNHEALPLAGPVVDPFRECTVFRVNGRLPLVAYANGKSAVRVGPDVTPDSAHRFRGYVGRHVIDPGPAILHYVAPCFDAWVTKYRRLGEFPDFWFGDPTHTNTVTHMLESRDLLRAALRDGDWTAARSYYAGLIPDAETQTRLLARGDLRRYAPIA